MFCSSCIWDKRPTKPLVLNHFMQLEIAADIQKTYPATSLIAWFKGPCLQYYLFSSHQTFWMNVNLSLTSSKVLLDGICGPTWSRAREEHQQSLPDFIWPSIFPPNLTAELSGTCNTFSTTNIVLWSSLENVFKIVRTSAIQRKNRRNNEREIEIESLGMLIFSLNFVFSVCPFILNRRPKVGSVAKGRSLTGLQRNATASPDKNFFLEGSWVLTSKNLRRLERSRR